MDKKHNDLIEKYEKNKLNHFQVVNRNNNISLRFACVINKILLK